MMASVRLFDGLKCLLLVFQPLISASLLAGWFFLPRNWKTPEQKLPQTQSNCWHPTFSWTRKAQNLWFISAQRLWHYHGLVCCVVNNNNNNLFTYIAPNRDVLRRCTIHDNTVNRFTKWIHLKQEGLWGCPINMPVWANTGQYWSEAGSIRPVLARYWPIMACLWGGGCQLSTQSSWLDQLKFWKLSKLINSAILPRYALTFV